MKTTRFVKRMKKLNQCKNCGQFGHNSRSCKTSQVQHTFHKSSGRPKQSNEKRFNNCAQVIEIKKRGRKPVSAVLVVCDWGYIFLNVIDYQNSFKLYITAGK